MTAIRDNFLKIKSQIPEHVKIVVVTKSRTVEEILEVYHCGHRIFGENKAQELLAKSNFLPPDIQWHFIGHLQTNKVKYLVPFVTMIHSIDSQKLLLEVNRLASKAGRVIPCLLQFHIASEETKFGFAESEALELLQSGLINSLSHIKICGVMGMATLTDDQNLIRREFARLREIFLRLKSSFFSNQDDFSEISMGMSNDYQIAIEEGSTMIRLGTAIFGERVY